MPRVSIGVNGGGTHVTARLIDHAENVLPDIFESGPANPRTAGVDVAADHIAEVVRMALAAAPPSSSIDHVACGIAGTADPERRDALRSALEARLGRTVFLTTDAEAALCAVAPRDPAMVLITGTGSIALGRRNDGTIVRAGGFGGANGDPGSATRIGNAIFAVENALSDERRALVRDRLRSDGVAALAPLVERWAREGVVEAVKILDDAFRDLIRLLGELRFVMGRDPAHDGAPLGLHGGVIENCAPLRHALLEALPSLGFTKNVFVLQTPPEVGAVRRAKAEAGDPRET